MSCLLVVVFGCNSRSATTAPSLTRCLSVCSTEMARKRAEAHKEAGNVAYKRGRCAARVAPRERKMVSYGAARLARVQMMRLLWCVLAVADMMPRCKSTRRRWRWTPRTPPIAATVLLRC